MNSVLWIIQIILGILFFIVGSMKIFLPVDKVASMLPWARDVSSQWPRFIGTCEVLGALGLILPGVTHIQPWLTTVAAGGLAMIMIDAANFHRSRREFSVIPVNLALFVLAIVVVIGRWVLLPSG